MTRKDYRNLEYYAQTFRDFLANPKENSGMGFNAQQKGDRVVFRIANINCDITFKFRKTRLYSVLEMQMEGNNSALIEIPVNVSKSKKGRVSGDSWDYNKGYRVYFNKMIGFVRTFNKETLNSE